MKKTATLQEISEFLRNAAYADNMKHGIDWCINVLYPRADWGAIRFSCGIWHSDFILRGHEIEPEDKVSVSFTFDDIKGIYGFKVWVGGCLHEMPFGETPTFEELKEVVVKKFRLKKLYS